WGVAFVRVVERGLLVSLGPDVRECVPQKGLAVTLVEPLCYQPGAALRQPLDFVVQADVTSERDGQVGEMFSGGRPVVTEEVANRRSTVSFAKASPNRPSAKAGHLGNGCVDRLVVP